MNTKSISQLGVLFLLFPFFALSQVGIGTTTPNAQLDIQASNQATPSNRDGILIPKVDEFPGTSPTAAQDGMLVYATGAGAPAKGFYYWNSAGLGVWVPLATGFDEIDWYQANSTIKPTNINSSIYTQGNVGIGFNNPLYRFDVQGGVFDGGAARIRLSNLQIVRGVSLRVSNESTTTETAAVGIENSIAVSISGGGTSVNETGIENTLESTQNGIKTGILNKLIPSAPAATLYAIKNELEAIGTGNVYGVDNDISGAGTGDQYGIRNSLTSSGASTKYGSYNYIFPVLGSADYGVYSEAVGPTSYAGYFLGRVSIGLTAANNYILPFARGGANQVMQTDGSGNVNWVSVSSIGVQELDDLSDGRTISTSMYIGDFSGFSDDGTNNQNIGIGTRALQATLDGIGNTVIGYHAGFHNSGGNHNTAMGQLALQFNTTGGQNTAIGKSALFNNTMASLNTAIGYNALSDITSGGFNSAVGSSAGELNIDGTNNIAFGYRSLATNTNGSRNSALGTYAGYSNLGSDNVFIGYRAGFNETGSNTLYIDNTSADSDNALIYGEFDINFLKVNADLQVGQTAANLKLLAADANNSSLKLFEAGDFGYEFQYNGATDKLHLWSRMFSGNEAIRMTWLKNGNVGISNTNPAYALDVTGDINTTGSIRQSGGAYSFPDYVFETYFNGTSKFNPEYTLQSLDTVEAFLKKNNHLPGVQSRADVAKNGWNVSENIRSNLEKIEELYLYVIEADKTIEKLSEENQLLRERLLIQQQDIKLIKEKLGLKM